MAEFSNQLINEPSPYLQQHAHNPVNWYAWNDDAFEKAKAEDKPIFLSIGYATCHWCHVMEHESFEDQEVADLLNRNFVCIKVDREERPDIDNIYMMVCQMTTGSGGWPLTILMTPEKKPFYAATYIPKQSRFGRPGLMQLLPRITQLWENNRHKLLDSSEEISNALERSNTYHKKGGADQSTLKNAVENYKAQFDKTYGGFSNAPKFPSPHNLMFLLRYGQQNEDQQLIEMVEKTLIEMRRGGIFDQIGFGFHRYSTDRKWLLPHFEKMLYDQAMLMMAYTEAWQLTKNPLFKQTVDEIFEYVNRDMTDDMGGFYSAEDADSEGEEGKFYVWSEQEVRALLPANQAELVIDIFNFDPNGNFADEASGKRTGHNIPHLRNALSELAEQRNMDQQKLKQELEEARKKLFKHREKRIHPLKDDKILTDWNGLMIAALAKASAAFDRDDYLETARDSYQFICEKMWADDESDSEGALLHRYRSGQAGITAHADDYAYLIWGLIELYQASFNPDYLKKARALTHFMNEHFWDEIDGGFFFTSDQSEVIIQRKKEFYDGALPSANSVMMLNLIRLSELTGNTNFADQADELNRLFAAQVSKSPTGFGHFLSALNMAMSSTQQVVICGDSNQTLTQQMLQELKQSFRPNTVALYKPNDQQVSQKLEQISPETRHHQPIDNQPTAYICQNFTCEEPVTDFAAFQQKLESD